MLGSSDKSVGAEVFACVNATCGHFYHPTCVARWLYRGNESEAIACQKQIAAGGSFICPVHKCVVCNAGENKRVADMQLAMCRRCPKSYHRVCLPRKIAFQAIEEEDIKQRAWDGLLPSRILIYCLKHKMIDGLGTPIRNHLRFPEILKREEVVERQEKKVKFSMVEKVEDFDSKPLKKTSHDIDNTASDIKSKSTGVKKIVSAGRSLNRSERNVTEQVPEAKCKRKYLKHILRPNSQEVDGTIRVRRKTIYKEIPKSFASTVPRSTTARKARKTAFPVIRDETVKETALAGLVVVLEAYLDLKSIILRKYCYVFWMLVLAMQAMVEPEVIYSYFETMGTTIMGLSYNRGMLLGGDTRSTTIYNAIVQGASRSTKYPGWSESFTDDKLKIVKASKDQFVTMTAGNSGITDILNLEVRSYIAEKKESCNFSSIAEDTKDAILCKLYGYIMSRLASKYKGKSLFSYLVVAGRGVKGFLVLSVSKYDSSEDWQYEVHTRSRVCIGGNKEVKDMFDVISETSDLEKAKTDMIKAMEIAAQKEDNTGGMLTLFIGSEDLNWECIYAEDFKGCEDDATPTQLIQEKVPLRKDRLFSVPITKPAAGCVKSVLGPLEVDGITIHLPTDATNWLKNLKVLIREGAFGSNTKHPIFSNTDFVLKCPKLVTKKTLVVGDNIKILIKEAFPVEVTTDVGCVTVFVDETTTVSNLRRLVKLEINKMNKKLENLFGRKIILDPDIELKNESTLKAKLFEVGKKFGSLLGLGSQEGLKNVSTMYNIGLRSCPDKEKMLWVATDGVQINRLQQVQKKYMFRII